MSDKKTFEGDINRIKAWIHFKDRSDVDEDTQLLISDVKLLFDMIAERDAKIADLIEDNVKADDTIEIYWNKSKALENEIEKIQSKLTLAIEGLRFYADEKNQIAPIYEPTGRPGADFTQPYRMDKGRTARETLAKIEDNNEE